jgi:hypothetical protein
VLRFKLAAVVLAREEFSLTKLEEMLEQARRQCLEKGWSSLLFAVLSEQDMSDCRNEPTISWSSRDGQHRCKNDGGYEE